MANDPRSTPVIVGVGEINDRTEDLAKALNSADLMIAAAREADKDSGGKFLALCDWIGISPQFAYPDVDEYKLVPQALGLPNAKVTERCLPHGDTPLRLLSEAANAIGGGEAKVALVTGGEAMRSALKRTSGAGDSLIGGKRTENPKLHARYGLFTPADVYSLYENATRAKWGQTLAEGQAETGKIWSRFSEVAAQSPNAWIKKPRTPAQITTVDDDNRLVAFPYTKFTVANSLVNQGAAFLVTSLALAREMGVAEDRIIYVGAGAAAAEASDPLERDAFTAPPAMRIVLSEAMKLNKLKPADIDHVELYSCFPVVPKMAQRELGLSTEMPFTVHGGLTFGGGPLGNYMSHGVIGLVRKLREGGDVGFIYGNGGYSTRHHALALTRKPVEGVSFPQNFVRQKEADALRQPIPEAHDTFEGEVKVETYTVTYDRKGEPTQGVVIARDPTDRRVLALVPKEDKASLAFLTSGKVEPVGSRGIVARNGDKLNWRPA